MPSCLGLAVGHAGGETMDDRVKEFSALTSGRSVHFLPISATLEPSCRLSGSSNVKVALSAPCLVPLDGSRKALKLLSLTLR